MSGFYVGKQYSRDQVAEMAGLPPELRKGGTWATGYTRWNDAIYIFCNVGVAGRTGHNYGNTWEGKLLRWFGKTGSRADQPLITQMTSGAIPVHVFWRGADRAPFTYAGSANALDVSDTVPVQVVWSFEPMAASLEPAALPQPIEQPDQTDRFRRGPVPTHGERQFSLQGGPCYVYVMRLHGDVTALMAHMEESHAIVKVGISNAPLRRREELNCGFPNGSKVNWEIISTRQYQTAALAFERESAILESLRLEGYWIGGEFAKLPVTEIPTP